MHETFPTIRRKEERKRCNANFPWREWRIVCAARTPRWQTGNQFQGESIVCDALIGYDGYLKQCERFHIFSSRSRDIFLWFFVPSLCLTQETTYNTLPTHYNQAFIPPLCPTSLANNLHNPWRSCAYPRSTPLLSNFVPWQFHYLMDAHCTT